MLCTKCRFCATPLCDSFCNLGSTPLSNSYLTLEKLNMTEPFYPLHVYVCSKCLLVQIPSLHTSEEIFSEYAYFSSYSPSWLNHCKQFAQAAACRFNLNHQALVIELASNDGYLLQFFNEMHIPTLGIEPARNVAQEAIKKGIPTRIDFFSHALARSLTEKADLLIGNNVLAHVPDLNDFILGMKCALKNQGVITMEFPHVLSLIEENQFDTIYHEHFSYFSLLSVKHIFNYHGLEIFDVDLLKTHGGSLRIYAKHAENSQIPIFASVQKTLNKELEKGLDQLKTYKQFSQQVEKTKNDLLNFFQIAKTEKKIVAGYGAPAKGNTLLNYCKVNTQSLLFTVDRNTYKQGKFLPGTHIPIYSPEKILEIKPDYLLILPWNLKEEIIEQTQFIRNWGGKHVVPIPQLQIFHGK